MPYLNILTASNIVEGLVASIFIVITYSILRNTFKLSKPMATMWGWFATWTLRKFAVNAYSFASLHYGFTIPPVRVYI
jgi:hypothetical protein